MNIYPNSNGWFYWSWNGVKFGKKTSRNSVWDIGNNITEKIQPESYYKELYNNASKMKDEHPGTWDMLFSGGIDSEVVVRVFKDLGIKHNTVIFRYENNYNIRDVSSAEEICKSLNIPYTIIDFELQKFYENEAYDLFKKTLVPLNFRLPHIKFMDYIDNIPVMGEAEPYWKRDYGIDYSKPSTWRFVMGEEGHSCSNYLQNLGRENICDWYEYTPNVIMAFNDLPEIKALLTDEYVGRQSCWFLRLPIHQKLWPDMKEKPKLVGYEQFGPTASSPPWIENLQKIMLDEVGPIKETWLTLDELNSLFKS
jgi:hypothetical protein